MLRIGDARHRSQMSKQANQGLALVEVTEPWQKCSTGKLLEELGGVAEMAGVAGVAGLAREADEAGCLPILAGPAEIDPVP